ncbi:TPA: dTMP kinase [Candidatus Galligastranaerophilus gallistercoris]|nr:dTMP kinase [Candidatus Galligastranaerophilus gallistercoris]
MYQNHGYPGLLIVLEGTDGVGKSTQVNLLKKYIENECYGCMLSEWKTSRLISNVINEAKDRNLLNTTTFSLLYAADYADRLENDIIPALKAGFVVILDRYIYTAFVRDSVRGHDINWVKKLYDFAPEPDLIFYLDVSVDVLLKRIIGSKGLDFYESGRDIGLSTDIYNSFEIYQKRCMTEYKKLQKEYNFININGELPIEEIHQKIVKEVKKVLDLGIVK